MKKLSVIVILAVGLAVVSAPSLASDVDDPQGMRYFDAIKEKAGYQEAVRKAIAKAPVDTQWKNMIVDGNVVTGLPLNAKIDGKLYNVYSVCLPHACGDHSARIAIETNGNSAAVYLNGQSDSRGFAGDPSPAMMHYLVNADFN